MMNITRTGGINHGSGIVLGHDADGGMVLIDRWNPPADSGITNKNFNLVSTRGGGVSHVAQLVMLREWERGAKVFVLDPGRKYQHACQEVGGDWLNAGGGTWSATGDADFVVVDTHDLQDAAEAVRRAQYLRALGYLWDLVRADRSERKLLVVDEAPEAPAVLKLMKSLSKRIRKCGGSLMVATQNVFDFLAPAVQQDGEPVLTNSAYTLLLRMNTPDLRAAAGLFRLSDAEQDKLRNARRGEGLLIAGNQRAWITIDTSPHESQIMYG